MRFDWKPESKERYFRKAEAAVKAAGFNDILRVDRDQFSVVKGTVKVHFKPISRDGKTRRWWEAKRTIENMHEVPPEKRPVRQETQEHFHTCFYDFRNGGAGQMKTYRQKHPYIAQIGYILRYKLQRFTWMFKVKDCRHICLFCEYYDTCRQEGKGK